MLLLGEFDAGDSFVVEFYGFFDQLGRVIAGIPHTPSHGYMGRIFKRFFGGEEEISDALAYTFFRTHELKI